ncbi:hypothetical protein GCM10022219_20060 [Microbacterium oryzae]|uniref:hypothetical protein n=1 Tax=Microbacterium oryzae TaxID=743009 RepID=UPI0012E0FCEA|nr:hypothetical protein [Microbacterium oryzae]
MLEDRLVRPIREDLGDDHRQNLQEAVLNPEMLVGHPAATEIGPRQTVLATSSRHRCEIAGAGLVLDGLLVHGSAISDMAPELSGGTVLDPLPVVGVVDVIDSRQPGGGTPYPRELLHPDSVFAVGPPCAIKLLCSHAASVPRATDIRDAAVRERH